MWNSGMVTSEQAGSTNKVLMRVCNPRVSAAADKLTVCPFAQVNSSRPGAGGEGLTQMAAYALYPNAGPGTSKHHPCCSCHADCCAGTLS